MHELSIAMNIIEIAAEERTKAGGGTIQSVELEVGTLSGVVLDALEFALEVSVKGTILEHAKIDIHSIEAEASCNQCGHVFTVGDLFTNCPRCHSFDTRLLRGGELQFRSLTLE
jgi:hydrogenase nickel incorporation protein HypA/HybF